MFQTLRKTTVKHLRSFLCCALILNMMFAGCSLPEKQSSDGESGDNTSAQSETEKAEIVISTISDQISTWKDGSFYPGAYKKNTVSIPCPTEYTSFIAESEGTVWAYGNPLNEAGTGRIHMARKYIESSYEDIFFSEISSEDTIAGLYPNDRTIYILADTNKAVSDTENSRFELFIYSTDGSFLLKKNLAELADALKDNDSYLYGFTDLNANLWICMPTAGFLYGFTPEGELFQQVAIPADFQGGFMRGKESDELIAVLGAGTGLVFWKLNTKTNDSETYTIENLPGVQSVFPGTTYDALVMTEKSVYGVDLGEPVLVKELFTFTDLGVDRTILRNIEDHKDGSLSAVLLERNKKEGEKVSLIPQTTKARDGLTLACLKSDEYLVYAVSTYNQQNPDNKVTIKEYYDKYAVDASETDALNRLNSDLMDGTAGDIVCLNGISFAGGGKALLEKGLFVDLYELMDNDLDFHKEDYFSDVWRANETDGKLYRLVPFFTLNTSFGRVDEVGETTHLDESVLFETDPVTTLFGPMYRRRDFVHDLLVFSLGDMTDPNAALYDASRMAAYIEAAGRMPEFEKYDNEEDGIETEAYNHAQSQEISDLGNHITHYFKQLLSDTSNNLNFYGCRWASAWLGETMPDYFPEGVKTEEEIIGYLGQIGIRVTFSGFPVKEGCGSALINRLSLAIPAGSEDQESAWIFLKSTLSGEYQSSRKLTNASIPVSKEVFYTFTEKLINDPDKTIDGELYRGYEGPNLLGDEPFFWWTPVLQQWMVDEFVDLLSDITLIDEVDPNVEAIVTEEIDKYCDGRQTAEEAARNIAERVELYRDEQ